MEKIFYQANIDIFLFQETLGLKILTSLVKGLVFKHCLDEMLLLLYNSCSILLTVFIGYLYLLRITEPQQSDEYLCVQIIKS